MKHYSPLAITLALLLALSCGAYAQEQKFDEYNFAFTPPAGWVLRAPTPPKHGMPGVFVKPGNTAMLMMLVDDSGHSLIEMDDAYASGLKKKMEATPGVKVTSGKFVEVGGTKSYELTAETKENGKKVSLLMLVVPSGMTTYGLQGVRYDGDAAQLPELRKALESFHFLETADTTGHAAPPPKLKSSAPNPSAQAAPAQTVAATPDAVAPAATPVGETPGKWYLTGKLIGIAFLLLVGVIALIRITKRK